MTERETCGETLNARAALALTANRTTNASGIARDLIALLQSDAPISQDVRFLMAEALEAGLDGSRVRRYNDEGRLIPRITIEDLGRDGRVAEGIAVRQNWLDAAEELSQERAKGRKGYELMSEVGAKYGLRVDSMKRAVKLHNAFLAEVRKPGSTVIAESLNYWGVNDFDAADEDVYYYARSLFIEQSAEAACK